MTHVPVGWSEFLHHVIYMIAGYGVHSSCLYGALFGMIQVWQSAAFYL